MNARLEVMHMLPLVRSDEEPHSQHLHHFGFDYLSYSLYITMSLQMDL
jgi:hypothetical protein